MLIDVVVPWQFRTTDIEPAMIELEGGTIESVAPVEAIGRVVGMVIDDGPTVPTDVVQAAQGASVELVRKVGRRDGDRAVDAERDADHARPPTGAPASPASPG